MGKPFPGQFVHFRTEGSLMAKLLATFVSGTEIEFEETETEKKVETEENLELNEISPVIYEETTNENEKWEEG